MISVASLQNSRKLLEVSDWDNTEYEWVITHYGTIEAWNSCETSEFKGTGDKALNVPAYDLSFLLDKLPERTNDIRDTVMLGRATDNKGWSIVYRDFVCIADTPVDAACLLCINLFETNMMKKGVN